MRVHCIVENELTLLVTAREKIIRNIAFILFFTIYSFHQNDNSLVLVIKCNIFYFYFLLYTVIKKEHSYGFEFAEFGII